MQKTTLNCTYQHSSFHCYYLKEIFSDFVVISDVGNVNDNHCLVWNIPWQITDTIKNHLDQGGKLIVDALWEYEINRKVIDFLSQYPDQVLILLGSTDRICDGYTITVPNWFWYNESLWWRDRGYHHYQPSCSNKNKKFFMPIRRADQVRDQWIDICAPYLDDAIWSYVGKGKRLPGYPPDLVEDQRFFNPEWYDSTLFSVVVESSPSNTNRIFITEKSCKPLAYYHPFMVLASPGSLAYLQSQGFETFPELFDESYDSIEDLSTRMHILSSNITNFDSKLCHTAQVKSKLEHNHHRFFDKELAARCITKEIVHPVLDFVNKFS